MSIPDLTAVLAERYRVTGPLGAGGMATVYRADDLRHGRAVAIKVLRPELGVVLGADRFLQEIRTTAGLQHPHILPLLDSGEAGGQVYYVMPLVEGETLRGRLARERQLPVAETMLLSRGHALVADFGIARAAKTAGGERLTETGMSLGTPAYMSPEQVAGDRELDHRADQYSLACVGYELLAGHPPFTGSSGAAVMARHVMDPVPALATVRPDVPRRMAAALERALGKSPAARFETMAAFAAALDQAEAPSDELSIVVLPFTNLSPDPDNAYFADGLTDEVIADLSKVRSLRVIARNSALQLRGTTKDSATIARELKVRYVLEGSVRRAGNALRITAQLVDGRSNSQLWADKYGGTMDDVFELQEKLSRSIVDALAIALSPEEDRRIAARPIADPRALECYQRAKVGIWSGTREGLESARVLLEQGASILGENALLLAAMANLEWSYVNWGIDPDERRVARALELANRAVTLDSGVAQAHAVLAFIKMNRGQVREAWSHARRAVDLEPNDAEVLLIWGQALLTSGKEGAQEVMERAVALDPLSPMSWAARSMAAWFSARFEDAVADLEQARRLDSSGAPVYRVVHALALTSAGRRTEAMALVTDDHSDQPGFEAIGTLVRLALAGDAPSFRATLTPALTTWLRADLQFSHFVAQLFALLGDADAAIDWLGNAVDRGFLNYPLFATVDPLLAPLRSHPRFQALMERTRVAWEAALAETAE